MLSFCCHQHFIVVMPSSSLNSHHKIIVVIVPCLFFVYEGDQVHGTLLFLQMLRRHCTAGSASSTGNVIMDGFHFCNIFLSSLIWAQVVPSRNMAYIRKGTLNEMDQFHKMALKQMMNRNQQTWLQWSVQYGLSFHHKPEKVDKLFFAATVGS